MSMRKIWPALPAILALIVLTTLSGCLRTTPPVVVVSPPKVLMDPCPEPENSGHVLELLRKGSIDDAALEHARYVLRVRDGFQLCNGQLNAIREYVESVEKRLASGK